MTGTGTDADSPAHAPSRRRLCTISALGELPKFGSGLRQSTDAPVVRGYVPSHKWVPGLAEGKGSHACTDFVTAILVQPSLRSGAPWQVSDSIHTRTGPTGPPGRGSTGRTLTLPSTANSI